MPARICPETLMPLLLAPTPHPGIMNSPVQIESGCVGTIATMRICLKPDSGIRPRLLTERASRLSRRDAQGCRRQAELMKLVAELLPSPTRPA